MTEKCFRKTEQERDAALSSEQFYLLPSGFALGGSGGDLGRWNLPFQTSAKADPEVQLLKMPSVCRFLEFFCE